MASNDPVITIGTQKKDGLGDIGNCGFHDILLDCDEQYLPDAKKEARRKLASLDERAKAKLQALADIVCSDYYTYTLPYSRRILNTLDKDQRLVLYDVLQPFFGDVAMEYLDHMVFHANENNIADEVDTDEWRAAVQAQHQVAYDKALAVLPLEIKKTEEIPKHSCPGCRHDLDVTWDPVSKQCTNCTHGSKA
ncbi:hypothetical protein VNI00_016738 [Paramarasmius palmivorus]|uniref:Uncharacterized protein n=1 Tax=Paramarasmius palmivorus TaxID=297713 RepID=A0AAW0BCA1_9AGAR